MIDIKTIDSYKFLDMALNGEATVDDVASYISERGPNSNLNCSYINWQRGLLTQATRIKKENYDKIISSLISYIEKEDDPFNFKFKQKVSSLETKILFSLINYFLSKKDYKHFDGLVYILFQTRPILIEDFFNIFKDILVDLHNPELIDECLEFMMNVYSIWQIHNTDGNHFDKSGKLMLYLYNKFSTYLGKPEDTRYVNPNSPKDDEDAKKYIIAYKRVNKDYQSFYNPSEVYEVGHSYYCISDGDPLNDNSFGLNCWHKAGVKEYAGGGHFLKVLININNITYCNLYDGKIRCSRFEVISEVHL